MNEISERRLAWQPDIYQRYSFLARLTDILSGDGSGALTLLDIGSGPVSLTKAFVSPRFDIVRADAGQFDDPSIVRLQPGEPLPFEDGAFDVAVAIEVLEHVPPAQRSGLVRELQRVSRQATILCCPVDTPEVIEAERQFSTYAKAVSGRDVDFLVEHRENGLPDPAEVVSWFSEPGSVLVADNAPLDEWLAFNTLDFIYAYDLGDDDAKARFAAAVNTRASLARTGAAHYRRFFCAFTSPVHAATASSVIDAARSRDPIEPQSLVRDLFTGILGWRQELRERSAHEVEALHRHVGELDAALLHFKEAVVLKDVHIGKLDQHLVATIQSLQEAQGAIGAKDAQIQKQDQALAVTSRGLKEAQGAIGAKDAQIQKQDQALAATSRGLKEAQGALARKDATVADQLQQIGRLEVGRLRQQASSAALAGALQELLVSPPAPGPVGGDPLEEAQRHADALRGEVAAARDQLQQLTGTLSGEHVRFEDSTRRTATLERELQVILTSRSWRLTAPLRKVRKILQQRTLLTSISWRLAPSLGRFKNALRSRPIVMGPVRALRDMRRWVRGRATSGRNYALAGEGGPVEAHATSEGAELSEALASRTLASGRPTGYVPPQGRLPWFNPLNLVVSTELLNEPRLNVLVPGLAMRHLSGGPNTALVIAGRLALSGVRVRLISTEAAFDNNLAKFRAHVSGLLGAELPADVQLVSANDRDVPLTIGARDLFMATAWWTAQQAKYAVRQTKHSRFVYLIQDYEPLLHPASTQQALATETYSLDHLPIVNSQWLHEFLVRERIGRFADPAFVERSLVFQPAVDRTLFFPSSDRPTRARRRLLFYARPTNAVRNLFELGVAALEKAVADGTFDPERWEFVGMGEPFSALSLGRGASLVPAPWLDLDGYAQQMRESDILLSLMLSPHPSYPPLEMAACGGLAVTTAFANKTSEALAELSANIIGTPPTVEGISEGLEAAVARLDDVAGRRAAAVINLPTSWSDSLAEVVPKLFDNLAVLQGSPVREGERPLDHEGASIVAPGFRNWPRDEYELHRLQAFARRRRQYPLRQEPDLFSLLTTVWNTPPQFLEALADSVLSQDADATFEWVLLDNGSQDPGTRTAIERLARERTIRVFRVEENLGIIGGMRFCLERAKHRYILPVDSDDLLAPDCLRVLTHALRQAGYPALAYTDEDKLEGSHFTQPYLKPAFDPVLFANSCYTAHLGAIDRELALELGAYTDLQTEGSHDWDTFTRFLGAGHTPFHIPEVLYSWRIHETSTSGGSVRSKPFVHDSQFCVLTKLLERLAPTGRFRVERPPLVIGMPDWWMRRDGTDARAVTTVIMGPPVGRPPRIEMPKAIPHEVVYLDPADGVAGLALLAARAAESGRLLHVLWRDTVIVDDVWALEAMGVFELFPDTAMVGGRLHQNGRIVDAGAYFGFGRGCDAPDRGRPLEDPGYHAQGWKPHSVSAVPFDHCVLDSQFAATTFNTLVPLGASLDQLGAWLGAAARRQGRRIIYTPFFSAIPSIDRARDISAVSRRAFNTAHSDLMPDAMLWPPQVGLKRAQPFRSMGPDAASGVPGEPQEKLSYDQELEANRLARSVLTRASADVSFSILTSVYSRTPAQFFELTARSLLDQRHTDFEWVVLENGPVPDDVARVLDRIAADQRVQRFACAENAGIRGAMRQCLARATERFVVPLDADDLLEPDALEVLAAAIDREQADFVFSDEDHLNGERAHTPYLRPGFDPVLNMESSYIWHLCAFSRERALELGVYSDERAEYCHDWDTVVRFSEASLRIAHVPHVLYHWRTHAESQSNTDTQNPGSLASMRAVIEGVLARRGAIEHYEIAEYPIDRGAVEWWMRRRPIGDPSFGVVLLGADEQSCEAAAACHSLARTRTVISMPGRIETLDDWRRFGEALADGVEYAVVLGEGWRPEAEDWLWEAIKWFELQPDTAIVGGRLIDDDGVVVDAGLGRRGQQVLPVYRSLRRNDPSAFALALKAQTNFAPAEGFFVGDRAFLRSAVESVLRDGISAPFAATLGALARDAGRRVVYSPLLEARRQSFRRDWGSAGLYAR